MYDIAVVAAREMKSLERLEEVMQGCSDLVDRLNSLVASDVKSGAAKKLSQSPERRTGACARAFDAFCSQVATDTWTVRRPKMLRSGSFNLADLFGINCPVSPLTPCSCQALG